MASTDSEKRERKKRGKRRRKRRSDAATVPIYQPHIYTRRRRKGEGERGESR